ncbi:MAG: Nif3-like dinuclear metal center hexameric protein [Bacteroidota bacterium]
MTVKDILKELESWAPPVYQESYDNSGLLVGDQQTTVSQVLVTLDVTMEVIQEAIATGSNLIVAHHPLIFGGLKRLTGSHWVQQCVIEAIKHDLCIYAIHTNLDNVHNGVNWKIAQKIGLENVRVLAPKSDTLSKLITFVPQESTEKVLAALYEQGVGEIGNYDHCSFQVTGQGTFRPNAQANPTVGQNHVDEQVTEQRLEVLFASHRQQAVIQALHAAHPYEEVAYYVQALTNTNQEIGSGAIGNLPAAMDAQRFLQALKERLNLDVIRHTALVRKRVETVALCGGSGSFLLKKARQAGADAFVSADFKYHDFFEAEKDIIVADVGHYESEVFTKDLIADRLKEKFANIAVRLSEVHTNPIKYL